MSAGMPGAVRKIRRRPCGLTGGRLGHGMEARQASAEAVRTLRNREDVPPKVLLDQSTGLCAALAGPRSPWLASIRCTASCRSRASAIIAGRIYSGAMEAAAHGRPVNGTAGHSAERLQEFGYPSRRKGCWSYIRTALPAMPASRLIPALPFAIRAHGRGVLYRDFARGRDDATGVIQKPRPLE